MGEKAERGADGRFKPKKIIYIDDHGYPRICAGPLRGKRLHVLIMEAILGRELLPTEDAHHRDENKLNFHWRNLEVIDHTEHGHISAKQGRYLAARDKELEKEWNNYHDSEAKNSEVVGASEVMESEPPF